MHDDRPLATRCLLSGTAMLVIIVAIMGCQDRDDNVEPPLDPTATEGAAADARPGDVANGIPNPTRAADREQGVTGISGESATHAQDSQVELAVAQIKPTTAGSAEGTVTFSAAENDGEMRVIVDLKGLEPGPHGLHVHEVGDCSADDASSAGGHFSPDDNMHGSPDAARHHRGDMGNIEADHDGKVSDELSFRDLTFSGPASILQKAVVIHRNADDLESQPAGDSGDRVGCGVIRKS